MKTEQLYSIFKDSSGVSTDTRNVGKNQMFFALWGDNFNGNQFAAEALARGAICAVIDDPAYESDNTILVDDCLLELQALAAYYRKELKIPVLAITGTNGKTTTKELISSVLSKKFRVHYTKGNLNNHIGVPITILSAPDDTEMLIVEMGANHLGEIRTLCATAKPDYGIITNISPAHLEGFGSFEGIIKAKTELFEHLRRVNGIALYNDNNSLLTERIYKTVNRAVPYSYPTGTPIVFNIIHSELNLCLTIEYKHRSYGLATNLFGSYNIENIRAAVATGLFMGVDIEEIIDAISKYHPANNRSQVKETENNTIICDSYNSNPISMVSSLSSFFSLNAENKVLILGDMLELGEKSEEEHTRILDMIKLHKLEKVFLVGPVFKKISEGYGFYSFENVGELVDYLKINELKDCIILVKGSRGIKLEKVYDVI